jgi:hypothetical protein
MKKILIINGLLAILFADQIYAAGLGAYFDGQMGRCFRKYNVNRILGDSIGINKKDYGSFYSGGCGISYASNSDSDTMIDYRLNIGFNYGYMSVADSVSLWRVSALNTFAVRTYQTDSYKIWIGPQVGLGYCWARSSYAKNFISWKIINGALIAFPESISRGSQSLAPSIGGSIGIYDNRYGSRSVSYEIGFKYNLMLSKYTGKNNFDLGGIVGFFVISYLFQLN